MIQDCIDFSDFKDQIVLVLDLSWSDKCQITKFMRKPKYSSNSINYLRCDMIIHKYKIYSPKLPLFHDMWTQLIPQF